MIAGMNGSCFEVGPVDGPPPFNCKGRARLVFAYYQIKTEKFTFNLAVNVADTRNAAPISRQIAAFYTSKSIILNAVNMLSFYILYV
ncbi:hypothetical protein A6U92_18805 [Agrobacterium rubi]|nr:hypothetical protein A6U92_18805 [Agrobacterium rubi]